MNQTIETLMNRRSVRAYTDQPLSSEERQTILHAAMRAPTAGAMMLYSVIEVEDQAMKDKLAVSCDNQPFIAKAPYVLLFLADYQRWMDYYKLCDVEALCARENIRPRQPQAGDLMLACCDALIAAQTSVIAAEALGIGSCYIGDIMEQYELHREMFDLPPYVFPITMVCFGYPTEQQKNREQVPRFDQEFVIYKNKYRRLNDEEFARMYAVTEPRWNPAAYLKSAANPGQHTYLRKFVADFSLEMNRSARAAMEQWLKGD